MTQTWDSRRLRHERDVDARLGRELQGVGQAAGRVILRYATATGDAGQRIVPTARRMRETLRSALWQEVVKPYFVGAGADALDGQAPQSPYARLLVDGITGAIHIQAERQVAIVERFAAADRVVLDWLTAPRPIGEMRRAVSEQGGRGLEYDPFHLFVDPNGYTLSDRIWRVGVEERARIDALLDYHVPRGTAAVDIADRLERFLTPGATRARTRTPYGTEGSYAARRLARTEITAAAGRACMAANAINPYVTGTDWRLSASHPRIDICDPVATLSMSGQRLRPPYPANRMLVYPLHPHDLCSLLPAVTATPGQVTRELRAQIDAGAVEARRLRGAFNLDWLVRALVGGWIFEAALGAAALEEAA